MHRDDFTASRSNSDSHRQDNSVKVDEKLANVLKIFAEKNIQPRSVSLLFGKTDDLVSTFGNFVLGSPVTMLPHLIYFARDRVDSSSKSATTAGKYSDKTGVAGSLLGLTTPEFETLLANGYNGWLKEYLVHSVGPHDA